MVSRIEWTGQDVVIRNLAAYGERAHQTVIAVADYWAPILEAYAKENAPWVDRTGNARQALRGWKDTPGPRTVIIYLSHGMTYGVYLELRWAGRYAIILPTLQAHYGEIARMLREIFK